MVLISPIYYSLYLIYFSLYLFKLRYFDFFKYSSKHDMKISIFTMLISFNFFQKMNFSLPFPIKANNECIPCKFIPNKGVATANSSDKDVILTFGANKLKNLFPFVKTLRTSGSRCRLIIFVNKLSLTIYPKLFYKSANDCGVEFFNFGSYSFTKQQAFFLRFYFYHKFLIQNREIINRVIFCDLYDTLFQSDPFTTEFGNYLYLTSETYSIRRIPSNRKWIEGILQ